jgi:mannan endo-1,4-beta-mannosidase
MTFWNGNEWIDESKAHGTPRSHGAPRGRMGRLGDQIATGAMIVGLAALFIPFASAHAGGPALALSPSAGAPGSTVQVVGTAFPSKIRVQLEWAGTSTGLPIVQVNGSGGFKTTFTVPNAASNSYTVSAVELLSKGNKPLAQYSSNTLANASFTVILLDPSPSPTPSTEAPGATPGASATAGPTATAGSSTTPQSSATPGPTSPPTPTDAPTLVPTPTVAPTALATPTPAPIATLAPPSGTGFVVRSGTTLTLAGAPYRFDGLNMYDAVQAPCWSQESLDQSLTAIGSGQEVARVFAFQRTATTSGARDWRYMDAALATFKAHGVRVIWVLTDQWYGQPCSDSASDRTLSWYQSGYKTTVEGATTYRDWVAQVVARYANNPTILAWQLVNEGEARNADGSCSEATATAALRSFADNVGGLINSIDPNHLVSLGTVSGECGSNEADYGYIQAGSAMDLCDYHDYGFATSPMGNTDPYNGLQASINRCHALGKAFMVGEMGIHYQQLTSPTTAYRATLFDAKLSAQFTAGSVGELQWCWALYFDSRWDYQISPGDESLALLGKS